VAFGDDAHDRQDAGAQGCRHEVRWREALTLPLVVGWSIGFQGGARWPVQRGTTQVPAVAADDLDHGAVSV